MLQPYRWFIGGLADGSYMFIPPCYVQKAINYIAKHGGGIYTHAGYLVMAPSNNWWAKLTKQYEIDNVKIPPENRPPHIDVLNIKNWFFTDSARQWLNDNIKLLQEIGGKYYGNLPAEYRK